MKIQPQIEKYSKNGEFALALESFKNIVSEIDMFFDKTMIMDEDKVLRKNRLALLNMVADIFNVFVDFSPIEL